MPTPSPSKVLHPPTQLSSAQFKPYLKKIFLAGSIDMDKAQNWQERAEEFFADEKVLLFNPRRKHWDQEIQQSIRDPNFREQVLWEIQHLKAADEILMNFDPAGLSPISLLEMGHFSERSPLTVVCPKAFWRFGVVKVFAERYGMDFTDTLSKAFYELKRRVGVKKGFQGFHEPRIKPSRTSRHAPVISLTGPISSKRERCWQLPVAEDLRARGFQVRTPLEKRWLSEWLEHTGEPVFQRNVASNFQDLDESDEILMHFTEDSLAPTSLLQFGRYVHSGKLTVSCERGFWRRGNLEIMCGLYGVPLFESQRDGVEHLLGRVYRNERRGF